MPFMSGRELAKRVQSIKPTTKVVYMSGYTDDTLAFHGFPQLNSGFIQKPFYRNSAGGESSKGAVGRSW